MSLIPMMKLRLAAPEQLIDIGRLKELSYIREEGGRLHIGAGTTHYEMESSGLARATVCTPTSWLARRRCVKQTRPRHDFR